MQWCVHCETYENIIEPVIKKFTSQEDVKKYYNEELKSKMNGRGPNKVKQCYDGYFRCTIRSKKIIMSCDDVKCEKKHGLNKNNYRLYPCYRCINDKSTLEWWLIHY